MMVALVVEVAIAVVVFVGFVGVEVGGDDREVVDAKGGCLLGCHCGWLLEIHG